MSGTYNPFVPQQVVDDTSNPLTAQAPTPADAWSANAAAYKQWADQQRQEGIKQGLINPETGWPTGAALIDAAHQWGNALIGSTSAPGGVVPGITAYHGSPHSFDKFDLGAIGTGEGAQAYGHGLYFASKEGVAQSYRDALSAGRGMSIDGAPFAPKNYAITQIVGSHSTDPQALSGALSDYVSQHRDNPFANVEDAKSILGAIQSGKFHPGGPGHMYEVNIVANPDHFLDWDKPLSEQHPVVQEALKKVNSDRAAANPRLRISSDIASGNFDGLNGEHGYVASGGYKSGQEAATATQALQTAGIPGIKYLDQGSRGVGEGSHNFVVFNPDNIAILRKYGIAGLMAGGGAAAASGDDTQ